MELDVYALGEHHDHPFVSSAVTTVLGFLAARTERITLSTSVTLITTNDPVRIAEEFATLQLLADGRVDLVLGRGTTPEGIAPRCRGSPPSRARWTDGRRERTVHELIDLVDTDVLPALRSALSPTTV